MKVAYISHHGRPCYEYAWLSRMNVEKVKFIDVDFSAYPKEHPDHVEYCPVGYTENRFLKTFFHSSASLIQYRDFEGCLEDVDVVIVLEAFSSLSRQFVQYCKAKGKKSVVLVYELIATHPLYYLPTHIFNRFYSLRNADMFVCVSEKAKDSLIRLGARNEKINVVYPGVDLDLFCPLIPRRKTTDLIFVGGLKVHKGIDMFLRLADALLPAHPSLKMTVVGDGTYRDIVTEYARKYPSFTYLGRLPNSDLPEVLSEHGIYVLPAREMKKYGLKVTSEQFGFSLVEAMACGLAVVSTRCGAIPEVVTDNNIILEQGDFESLLAVVSGMILDPEKTTAMAQRNIGLAKERYDIRKQGVLLAETLCKN